MFNRCSLHFSTYWQTLRGGLSSSSNIIIHLRGIYTRVWTELPNSCPLLFFLNAGNKTGKTNEWLNYKNEGCYKDQNINHIESKLYATINKPMERSNGDKSKGSAIRMWSYWMQCGQVRLPEGRHRGGWCRWYRQEPSRAWFPLRDLARRKKLVN